MEIAISIAIVCLTALAALVMHFKHQAKVLAQQAANDLTATHLATLSSRIEGMQEDLDGCPTDEELAEAVNTVNQALEKTNDKITNLQMNRR